MNGLNSDGSRIRITANDFHLIKVVGKGSFGKVVMVRKKDSGKVYAMKVLRKETVFARRQVENTKSEREILQKIDHPFIARLRYAWQTNDKLYLVMDYFAGGELFFHLQQVFISFQIFLESQIVIIQIKMCR